MPDMHAASNDDKPAARAKPAGARGDALRRHLRRWGAYWLAAVALLVASQVLWRWQTWPVRALLPDAAPVAAPGT